MMTLVTNNAYDDKDTSIIMILSRKIMTIQIMTMITMLMMTRIPP